MTTRRAEITAFQERAGYDRSIDLRTDVVMAYGMDDTTVQRVADWRSAGYRVHIMTGISWGHYEDYLDGRWNGVEHWGDAQTNRHGETILHGPGVPYMVPTIDFTEYLFAKLRPLLDLEVDAIHLEEPEFWARGGYSDAFRREWRAFYGEPWLPPHSSPDAFFRSGRLMQHLFSRALERIATALRDESIQRGREVRFYIPTHSLLNYTQWQIVSPESRLRTLPGVQGAIAQVWTGTSRTANVYAGRRAERTLETAFLEYGIAQDLTRGTGRTLWFLHDPIEDHSGRTWDDYFDNYRRTVVASLLHPAISRYEVAPWPWRIFNREYRRREGSDQTSLVPPEYATTYLVVMNTLRDMDQPVIEPAASPLRIGVFLVDSAMFQRWFPSEDEQDRPHEDGLKDGESRALLDFSAFYGLALPPLFAGQFVVPVQLDAVLDNTSILDDYDILVLSYEFQKPLSPAVHYALAAWVGAGGTLLYVGDGADPYHETRAWWTGRYPTPAHHLAEAFTADIADEEIHRFGNGFVQFVQADPVHFSTSEEAAAELVGLLRGLADARGSQWRDGDWLSVQRGPYVIGATLSEATEATTVRGSFIDLLDPALPVVQTATVPPSGVALLRDLTYEPEEGAVLASAGRIDEVRFVERGLQFDVEAPTRIDVVTAVRLAGRPREVLLDGTIAQSWSHDEAAGIMWIRHPGDPSGTKVHIALM